MQVVSGSPWFVETYNANIYSHTINQRKGETNEKSTQNQKLEIDLLMLCKLTVGHNHILYTNYGVVKPGQSVQVNLVRGDKTHVFKHAEDALQTHKHNWIHQLLLSNSNLSLLSVIHTFPPEPPVLTKGVVSSGSERGVYVNSA